MSRTVQQWREIFGRLPERGYPCTPEGMAKRIFGDLTGYNDPRNNYRDADAKQLANAMQAFAEMQVEKAHRELPAPAARADPDPKDTTTTRKPGDCRYPDCDCGIQGCGR